MTHRFFVAPHQLQDDEVTFSPEQTHQLQHVLRLRAGDTVRIFDGLAAVDRLVAFIWPAHGRITGSCPQAAEPRTRLVVYPALLQRDKFEQVLQKLTEIGVAAIAPVLAARSLVRAAPDAQRLVRWQSILREAAEQSGRGSVPNVLPALPLAAAIDQAVGQGPVLVAHEAERRYSIRAALATAQPPHTVSLFVGPEGGYAPEEIDLARSADARLVTLGPRILRAETASPLFAGLVLYDLGELSSADDEHD